KAQGIAHFTAPESGSHPHRVDFAQLDCQRTRLRRQVQVSNDITVNDNHARPSLANFRISAALNFLPCSSARILAALSRCSSLLILEGWSTCSRQAMTSLLRLR